MSNVWTFPYRTRYYLTHPWKWFAQIGRNIRATYMRTKYGWTYSDVWDWDYWFMNVVPEMFRYLAEHGCAYPGYEPFETPEKWREWLLETADLIETGKEDWQDEHNKYCEEYTNTWDKELGKKYFARAEELRIQGERNIRIALGRIAEHFYNIWD